MTEIKPKFRLTLAQDFQGKVLHKAGSAVVIPCEVNSKDLGQLIFIIPDPVSLFFNQVEFFIIRARRIKSKLVQQKKTNKAFRIQHINKYLQASMGAYVFLAAALESFLNIMIPGDYIYKHSKKGDLDKTAIQRELGISTKIDIIAEVKKLNIKSNWKMWKPISDLLDTRNEILHLKDLRPVDQGVIYGILFDTDFNTLFKHTKEFILAINPEYFD